MTNLLEIAFPPVTFPVGTYAHEQGYWTHYENLRKDGIRSIMVRPHIILWGDVDTPHDPTIFCDLHMVFDPAVWNTSIYGLIYTDPTFEEAVQAWAQTFGLHTTAHLHSPSYTEQGMQTDDYVSMEFSSLESQHWTDAWGSHHAALAWCAGALARGCTITVNGRELVAQPQPVLVEA